MIRLNRNSALTQPSIDKAAQRLDVAPVGSDLRQSDSSQLIASVDLMLKSVHVTALGSQDGETIRRFLVPILRHSTQGIVIAFSHGWRATPTSSIGPRAAHVTAERASSCQIAHRGLAMGTYRARQGVSGRFL
jgi:hypothetical protein